MSRRQVSYSAPSPCVSPKLPNLDTIYWTSSSSVNYGLNAWCVNFNVHPSVVDRDKDNYSGIYVRCVRSTNH